MVKKTLIIGLVVLVLNFQAFGAAWYSENFDKFNDGNIVGLLYNRIYVLIIPKAHLGIIVAHNE